MIAGGDRIDRHRFRGNSVAMKLRGRLVAGGLCVVVGVLALVVWLGLPDAVGPTTVEHPNPRFLVIAGVAVLIALGVLIGALPASRSPYRLILSGFAIGAALMVAIALPADGRPWSITLSMPAQVAAVAVTALLVGGAAVIAGHGWIIATASAVVSLAVGFVEPQYLPAAVQVLFLVSVLLTGDRRDWLRTGVAAALAVVASYVALIIPAVAAGQAIRWWPGVASLPAIYATDALPGLLLGTLAAALVLLARPRTGEPGVRSGYRVESDRLRRLVGGLVIAGAIVAWSFGLASFEPELRATVDLADAQARAGGPFLGDADMVEALGLAGKDFRWAAIILGLGGVLLFVRGSNRRTVAAVVALVGWLTADVVGDRLDPGGWGLPDSVRPSLVFGVSAAVVVTIVVTVAVVLGRRVLPGPQRPVGLRVVYAAVAFGAAPMLAYADGGNRYLPTGMQAASAALAILLVLVGVTLAAAAAPERSRSRLAIAALVGVLAAALMAWRYLIETTAVRIAWGNGLVVPLAGFLAASAFAVVALGLNRPRTGPAWFVAVLTFVVTPPLAWATLSGAVWVGYRAEDWLSPLTGDPAMFDGYPMVVIGAAAGLTLAMLLVVPGSWWGRPSAPAPDPATDAGPESAQTTLVLSG